MKWIKNFLILLLIGLPATGFAQNQTETGSESFTSLSNGGFQGLLADSLVQLVDVRTPEEALETGIIPGAVVMDYKGDDFDKEIATLNPEYPVAVYCRSGRRSKEAAKKLAALGFTVYELDHGILEWDGPKEAVKAGIHP